MQIQILIGSALIFPVYAVLLLYYLTIFYGLGLSIAYFSTQVLIGLLLTRSFQGLGTRTKSKLKLQDPSSLDADWNTSNQELNTEELTRLFDDIGFQLQKYDPSVDDVIDLTWFGVIVWAVISTAITAVFSPHILFYITPPLVLPGLCAASFYTGYRAAGMKYYDENIEHLKHLVLSRISALHTVTGERHFQPAVRWLRKGKKQVLGDIFIQILNRSRKEGLVICYWLGLPSSDDERMIFDVAEKHLNAIQESLLALPILSDFGWKLEIEPHNAEPTIVLRNERVLRIDVQSTMVRSPSQVKEISEKLADALSAAIHAIGG